MRSTIVTLTREERFVSAVLFLTVISLVTDNACFEVSDQSLKVASVEGALD